MKETYYFPHDYHARHDIKMANLSMEQIGIFWCLVEMLYEENGYIKLNLCQRIASAMRVKCEALNEVIHSHELFEKDETLFWSNSVLKRLEIRNKKSEKARELANRRWNSNAKAMPTQCQGNAIKERKGKEKKDIMANAISLQELIKPLTGQYTDAMVAEFLAYWTEKNPNGIKERWQLQKIFDPKRRLATWASKSWNKEKPKKLNPLMYESADEVGETFISTTKISTLPN